MVLSLVGKNKTASELNVLTQEYDYFSKAISWNSNLLECICSK